MPDTFVGGLLEGINLVSRVTGGWVSVKYEGSKQAYEDALAKEGNRQVGRSFESTR